MHRNSQKRYLLENHIYFTVSKTDKNFPYFKEPIFCELLIEEIKLCKLFKEFRLIAFSIIYDHLNLIAQPYGNTNISKLMQFIKKHTSRNINYIIAPPIKNDINNPHPKATLINVAFGAGHTESTHVTEGDNNHCRLRHAEYEKYEIQINKFIEKLNNLKTQFHQKYDVTQNPHPKFRWQKSYRDHVCRDDHDLQNHYTYTVYNHQKHGLPENWPYTSLNYPDMID